MSSFFTVAGSAPAVVTNYVFDGGDIVLQLDGAGAVTHRYLHGSAVDQVLADDVAGGDVLWSLGDNLGTVRDVVDSTGAVKNHLSYDSFGNVTAETHPDVVIAKQRLEQARQLARTNTSRLPLDTIDQQIAFNNSQIAQLRAAKAQELAQMSSQLSSQAQPNGQVLRPLGSQICPPPAVQSHKLATGAQRCCVSLNTSHSPQVILFTHASTSEPGVQSS